MISDPNLCPVCFQEYDLGTRLPRIFMSCGHTICSSCLTSYCVDEDLLCPLDGSRIPHLGKGIEILPPNYALKQVIEKKEEKDLCQEHLKKVRFICLDDGCQLCDDCTHYTRHRAHTAKLIKEVESEANKKITKLEDAFDAYDSYWKGIEKIFDDTRSGLLKTVREESQNLRWLVLMKELELSYNIDSFFNLEKAKLNANLGYDSTSRKEIVDKIVKLKEMLKTNQTYKILKEDIASIVNSLKFDDLHHKTQDLRKSFEDILQTFNTELITRVQPFIVLLDFPATELSEKIEIIYFEDEEENTPLKKVYNSQIVSVNEMTHLNFKPNQQQKAFTLNPEHLEEIRKVTSPYINNESKEEVDKIIFPLWKMLRGLESINIDFASKKISDREFFDCCLLSGWSAEVLHKFEVLVQDSNIKDYDVIPLLSEILPRMSRLKAIHLDLSNTELSDRSLKTFPIKAFADQENLEDLHLNLTKTNLTDVAANELFNPIKSLRKVHIALGSTQISDQSLYKFAKTTLPALRNLDDLWLDLSNTKVSDQSIMQIFQYTKTIKRLFINLSYTQVTNQSLNAFIMYTLPYSKSLEKLELCFVGTSVNFQNITHLFLSMYNRKHLDTVKLREQSIEVSINYPLSITKNLENLEIDLSATKATDEDIQPIFVGLETVKALKLVLSFCNITNETLRMFARQSLVTAKNLKALELNFSNTRVSDEGIIPLFIKFESVTTFILNLSSTAVTDRSINIFLENTLPSMTGLTKFSLNISHTQVSPSMQSVVSQLAVKYF